MGVAASALILGGITTAAFFMLSLLVPGFNIKSNATRVILTIIYFFVSVFVSVIVCGLSFVFVKYFPGAVKLVVTMINMTVGFILTSLISYKLLAVAEKNINNVKVGRGGVDYVVKGTVSTLLGAASAVGYLALPYLI